MTNPEAYCSECKRPLEYPQTMCASCERDLLTASMLREWHPYYDRDGNPVDLMTWAALFESADRIVAQTTVGRAAVSTVWLGIAALTFGPVPMIYETMIFGGTYAERRWVWATEDAARAGHDRIVAALKAGDEPEG